MAERAREPGPVGNVVRCPSCGKKNRLRPRSEGVPRCAVCKTLLPWIAHADESTFEAEVDASVPVVVDFWAPWCGPCRMVEPVLQRLARDQAGRLKIVEVDVDQNPQLAARYQAMSIPLLVVIRGGEEIDRIVGALPPAELERRLQPVLEPGAQPAGSTA
jgi:thioredoxin 2